MIGLGAISKNRAPIRQMTAGTGGAPGPVHPGGPLDCDHLIGAC